MDARTWKSQFDQRKKGGLVQEFGLGAASKAIQTKTPFLLLFNFTREKVFSSKTQRYLQNEHYSWFPLKYYEM